MRSQKAALANNVDSDLAVKAYIESLLFESEVAFDTDVAESAVSQNASPELGAIAPTPIHTLDPNQSSVNNLEERAEVDALADIDFDNDSLTAEAAKNNPFLKQLEAAQRRGRAKMGAAVSGSKVDNRPAWGGDNFRCLAFNVSGLKLAVPVQFVDSMQPLDLISVATSSSETSLSKGEASLSKGEASLLKGEASSSKGEASSSNPLILGQMKVDRGEDAQPFCAVLDTARLVMPERYDNGMQESYRYVLTLKNCDWSIAVDSIGGEIGLTPQNVRWRSEHTRREWLAGTVVDKMCALIDIDLLNRQMMADAILMESDE
ncbi:MAG: hypothetical protein HOL40_02125 [Cellvibrionales bacterium]|nr:hypothetical protein [Cellvibrionales bacterium]